MGRLPLLVQAGAALLPFPFGLAFSPALMGLGRSVRRKCFHRRRAD